MEEIKVGEYIRTPYNKIEKVTKIKKEKDTEYYTDDIVFTDKNAYSMKWLKENNAKHSFNIIELIKVR